MNISLGDPCGESLHHRSFADAGFADQTRVVFSTSGKYLNDPLGLALAPDDRVDLIFTCKRGKIAPISCKILALCQSIFAVCIAAARAQLFHRVFSAVPAQKCTELADQIGNTHSESTQKLCRHRIALVKQCDQYVLCTDVRL